MKKVIVALLSGLLIVVTLSACGLGGKISEAVDSVVSDVKTTTTETRPSATTAGSTQKTTASTEKKQTSEASTTKESVSSEKTDAVTAESTTGGAVSEDLIRSEVKDAIDAYEAYIDEYCKFMETYDSGNTVLLMQYMQMLAKIEEYSQKWEKMEEDWTEAELTYFWEVSLRCNEKMLKAAESNK